MGSIIGGLIGIIIAFIVGLFVINVVMLLLGVIWVAVFGDRKG